MPRHILETGILLALLTGLAVCVPAQLGAQTIPPGDSGAGQYGEGVPEADGRQGGRGSQGKPKEPAPSSGDQPATGTAQPAPGSRSTGVRNLPSESAAELRSRGRAGEDAISALNASTPNGRERRRGERTGSMDRGAPDPRAERSIPKAEEPSGLEAFLGIFGAGNGLGAGFPALILASLGLALVTRRRRASK